MNINLIAILQFNFNCFRYCEGTGSILQSAGLKEDLDVAFKNFVTTQNVQDLTGLKLRYFSPREISNLLGFPPEFSFPDHVTLKQKYKVLGNSLNVTVVSLLLHRLVRQ